MRTSENLSFLGRAVNKGRHIGFGDVWGGFEGDREHRWAPMMLPLLLRG